MPERRRRMGKKRRGRQSRPRGDDSSSSYSSSSDGMSTEETPATRSPDIVSMIEEAISKTISKETEGIKQKLEEQLKEEFNKIHRQLNKLMAQVEQLNGSSGDGSPAPRSEPNHMQPPIFSLKIKSRMKDSVEKGNSIITDDGDSIVVDLYDGDNLIAPRHPLASARVMMVVLDGKFNNSRCSWSREDFEKSIKRPREGNSAIGDVNQGIESIVSNCIFNLEGGTRRHSGATIWENSGNSKVKLGVMVLPDDSYGEYKNKRVLEGVSKESFLVRDPPRPSKKQKEMDELSRRLLPDQEQNGPMPNTQYLPCPTLNTQTAGNGQLQIQAGTNMRFIPSTLGAYQFSVEPSTNQQSSLFSGGDRHISAGVQTPMISDSMNQTMHSHDGGVQPMISDSMNQPMHDPYGVTYSEDIDPNYVLRSAHWMYGPDVETSKRWNLLDHLMLLYSSQRKIHSGDFPTMHLMPEHYDSLTTYPQGPYQRLFFNEQALFLMKKMRDLQITTIPKEVMQTRPNRGVLIQPLEPDDSDDESPLKRKLRNKYQLRFVNKVCDAYYTGEKIKADDGNLLNVALYDENNAKITSGPLSSASVDFNAAGRGGPTGYAGWATAYPRPGAVISLVAKAFTYLKEYRRTAEMDEMKNRILQALQKILVVFDVVNPVYIKEMNSALDAWLWQLRDAVEKAEDTLDEIEYYELEEKAKDRKVSDWGSSGAKMKHEVVRSIKHVGILDKTKGLTQHGTLKRLWKSMVILDRTAAGVVDFLSQSTPQWMY